MNISIPSLVVIGLASFLTGFIASDYKTKISAPTFFANLSPEKSDELINSEIDKLLVRFPNAARVKVAVIQSTIPATSPTQIPLFRYDVLYGKANPNAILGELAHNVPLSQASDYLPKMLAGKCTVQRTRDMADETTRLRLEKSNTDSFVACPIIDGTGNLIGFLYVGWDTGSPSQQLAKDPDQVMSTINLAARRIAVDFSNRTDARWP